MTAVAGIDMAKITAEARAELTLALVSMDLDPDARTAILGAAEHVWAQIEAMWTQMATVYEGVDKLIQLNEVLQSNAKILTNALNESLGRWEQLAERLLQPNPDRLRIAALRKLVS